MTFRTIDNFLWRSIIFRPWRGDHLGVLRRFPKRIFHHGIYIGNDEVIDVTDEGIRKIDYSDFKSGCYMYEVQYGYGPSTAKKLISLWSSKCMTKRLKGGTIEKTQQNEKKKLYKKSKMKGEIFG